MGTNCFKLLNRVFFALFFHFIFSFHSLSARTINPFVLLDELNYSVQTALLDGLSKAVQSMLVGKRSSKSSKNFKIEPDGEDVAESLDFVIYDQLQDCRVRDKIPSVCFNDIAGIDHIIDEVKEIIDYLKYPEKYKKLGAKVATGILLEGPPGVGKTMVAKALAHEAGCDFFYRSGSEFVELYVGQGAARVRELFQQARASGKPAIIFIDEIDAVGGSRGAGFSGGDHEYDQTLNELLIQIQGFEQDANIIVIAATNRADMLDPALKRPGRFTKILHIGLPDEEARCKILELYINKLPFVTGEVKQVIKTVESNGKTYIIDGEFVKELAERTSEFSGAELEDVINNAALFAVREDASQVEKYHFERAIEDALQKKHLRSTEIEIYRN